MSAVLFLKEIGDGLEITVRLIRALDKQEVEPGHLDTVLGDKVAARRLGAYIKQGCPVFAPYTTHKFRARVTLGTIPTMSPAECLVGGQFSPTNHRRPDAIDTLWREPFVPTLRTEVDIYEVGDLGSEDVVDVQPILKDLLGLRRDAPDYTLVALIKARGVALTLPQFQEVLMQQCVFWKNRRRGCDFSLESGTANWALLETPDGVIWVADGSNTHDGIYVTIYSLLSKQPVEVYKHGRIILNNPR